MNLSLSENICRLRKERGMTQEALAEALGVSFASVSKWERRIATPELNLIAKMAELFQISVDALLGFELKSGGAEEHEKLIRKLQSEKEYDKALIEAEKALINFPNDFRIVYRAGELYAVSGVELNEEKYTKRAVELLCRSVTLLSQNTNPDISEASIKLTVAQCYIALNKPKLGVEILKKCNPCNVHDALIANVLASVAGDSRNNEAPPFMCRAFESIIANALRMTMAYTEFFTEKRDYSCGREVLIWLINMLEGAKLDKDLPSYLDKMAAPCYALCAKLSLLLGEEQEAENYMMRAHEVAGLFDSAPSSKLENTKFSIIDFTPCTTYDNLGNSASEAVKNVISCEKLLNLWERTIKDGEIK